jgi:methionyl-tRNA synthetase
VFGHPWFNAAEEKGQKPTGEDVKMSKSRGNVIYADELAETFGVDGVRYFALSEMPYDQDGRISYTNVLLRYNMDLANNLGNLVSRTHAMTKKYFDGIVPAPAAQEGPDADLKETVCAAVRAFAENMDTYRIADAAEVVFSALRRANKYIDETMPWALAKDEEKRARLGTVLYNLLESIRVAAVLLTALIPDTCAKIFAQLGTDRTDWESAAVFGALESGKPLGDAVMLFARVDEKLVDEIIRKKAEAAAAAEKLAAPVEKPEGCALIGIEDFMNVELRTAKVIACERVPKAKKLLKLQLDLGYEQRQVVSGIAKFYEPEALVGKKLIVVANLKPATLCGIESQGMILASGEDTVRVVFLDPETPLGERVR